MERTATSTARLMTATPRRFKFPADKQNTTCVASFEPQLKPPCPGTPERNHWQMRVSMGRVKLRSWKVFFSLCVAMASYNMILQNATIVSPPIGIQQLASWDFGPAQSVVIGKRPEKHTKKVEALQKTMPTNPRLPKACLPTSTNHSHSSLRIRPGYPEGYPGAHVHFNSIQKNVEQVPSAMLYEEPMNPFEPMVLLAYDKVKKKVVQLGNPFKDDLPVNRTMVCIPEGIVLDNSIGGPFMGGDVYKIYMYQWLKWHPQPFEVGAFIKKSPKIIDMPGLGVQISSWTGFVYNHFMLDSFVRIALVLDLLKSDLPLWQDAKLIISTSNPKNITQSNQPAVHKFVHWMYDQLGLIDRLIPNNGWLRDSNHSYRFEYLILPDVSPHPTCGTDNRVKLDACFPRGVLRPIQDALGALETNPRKWIVYAHRSNNIARGLDPAREAEMLAAVQKLLDDRKSNLKLTTFQVDRDDPAKTLEFYKNAAVTFGPHGAQLWNAALSPPGGLFVEFNTYNDTFLNEDCRAHGYSLANAAGLDYALVETSNFTYDKFGLLPDTESLVEIIKHFLDKKGW